jgi:hypothetical protein
VAGCNEITTSDGICEISEDVTAAIEDLDLSDFGSGEEDQKALTDVLLEYSEVFSPRQKQYREWSIH